MDAQFEKVKRNVELEQGEALSQADEIEVKGLFYFAKGIKLENQLKSEPERLGDICECVLADIRRRMERHPKSQHRRQVVSAVGDFLSGKATRAKQR